MTRQYPARTEHLAPPGFFLHLQSVDGKLWSLPYSLITNRIVRVVGRQSWNATIVTLKVKDYIFRQQNKLLQKPRFIYGYFFYKPFSDSPLFLRAIFKRINKPLLI